ncbi:MAG: porphobilinogen synthase [Hyphomicrobiales bacterium]|nr:porphobilinogen synthase [Hyphomicrobiales bacterium]MCY4032570.1 porphobilinogen synthase [Hyphomicrobiales bacterium]MCY4037973.1 porphobilinogen synthase [Hyphomicrobiales bacterium]
MRRLRSRAPLRRLVAEHHIRAEDLILPIFLCEGANVRSAITSMPGIERLGIDVAVDAVREAADLGIPAVALFPQVEASLRDDEGSLATDGNNLVCRALREIRASNIDVSVMCDVALDPYTSHGHDGVLRDGRIHNDETIEILVRQALVQAESGCDIIAPSDMMDGRIGRIRNALEEHGHHDVCIMSYAAKYASALYAPFREAIGSDTHLRGDKRTYQMDFANGDEALWEVALDIQEGADMVMVKPGILYLDIVRRVREQFGMPTFAYQVSGEYAMIRNGIDAGYVSESVIEESLLAFKRAGADGILTYFAKDIARGLSSTSTIKGK